MVRIKSLKIFRAIGQIEPVELRTGETVGSIAMKLERNARASKSFVAPNIRYCDIVRQKDPTCFTKPRRRFDIREKKKKKRKEKTNKKKKTYENKKKSRNRRSKKDKGGGVSLRAAKLSSDRDVVIKEINTKEKKEKKR